MADACPTIEPGTRAPGNIERFSALPSRRAVFAGVFVAATLSHPAACVGGSARVAVSSFTAAANQMLAARARYEATTDATSDDDREEIVVAAVLALDRLMRADVTTAAQFVTQLAALSWWSTNGERETDLVDVRAWHLTQIARNSRAVLACS